MRDDEMPHDSARASPLLGVISVSWGLLAACVGFVAIDHGMSSATDSRTALFGGAWMLLSAVCLCVGGGSVATGRGMRWLVLVGVISQAIPFTLLALRSA